MTDNTPSYATAKKRVRAISHTTPGPGDYEDYRAEVDAATHDRGAAVLLSTNLEGALESAIVRRLQLKDPLSTEMFGINGPFGDFHAKILLAEAIGILGPQARRNFDIIRIVRNTFAHAGVSLKFDHADIKLLCSFLMVPSAVLIGGKWHGPPPKADEVSDTRYLFQTVCTGMSLALIAREMAGPTGIHLNGLKDQIRDSIKSVVGADAEIWAVPPPLP